MIPILKPGRLYDFDQSNYSGRALFNVNTIIINPPFLALTFSKGYNIIRLFGRQTRAQCVDGNQPETVHVERQKASHLVCCQIAMRVYELRLVPRTVFADPVKREREKK